MKRDLKRVHINGEFGQNFELVVGFNPKNNCIYGVN